MTVQVVWLTRAARTQRLSTRPLLTRRSVDTLTLLLAFTCASSCVCVCAQYIWTCCWIHSISTLTVLHIWECVRVWLVRRTALPKTKTTFASANNNNQVSPHETTTPSHILFNFVAALLASFINFYYYVHVCRVHKFIPHLAKWRLRPFFERAKLHRSIYIKTPNVQNKHNKMCLWAATVPSQHSPPPS